MHGGRRFTAQDKPGATTRHEHVQYTLMPQVARSCRMSAWLLWNLDDDQQLRQRLPLLAARSLEYVVWPAAVSRIGRRRS